jgi:hypothetical protein
VADTVGDENLAGFGGGGGGGGSPRMSPFPASFPDLVGDTGKLQAAFITAKASVKADGLAAGLVDVDGKPLDVEKIPMTRLPEPRWDHVYGRTAR